jgi:raffinose/stachyose/melibiose transport system substrate-binding protein
MKRPSSWLVAGLSAIFLTVGSAAAQEKVTLSFLHKWPEPDNAKYFQEIVKKFEATHPNVSIKMEAVADDPYKDKIRVIMSSGNIPDIFFSWSGEYIAQFVRAGRALDLTAAYAEGGWKDRFTDATLEPFRVGKGIYGVPMNLSGKFVAYNKAHFAKIGAEPPKDFDEFVAIMEKLKAAGITPVAFGGQAPWADAHYLGDFNAKLVPEDVRRADYDLSAPADKLFTHPGYVEALARFQDFATKGWFNKGPNALTNSIARGSFTSGREALFYEETLGFKQYQNSKLAADGFGFFPMPPMKGAAGRQDLLTGAPDGFVVSAGSKAPKEAIAFLRFLTEPENAAAWTKASGRPTAVKGAVTTANALPEVVAGVEAINRAAGMAIWLDTAVDSRIVGVWLPGMQAVLGGTETPQQVMDKVRQVALQVKAERK